MERTTEQEREGPAGGTAAEGRDRDARARAHAYLDLWEKHVVQTALHGPVAPWHPTSS